MIEITNFTLAAAPVAVALPRAGLTPAVIQRPNADFVNTKGIKVVRVEVQQTGLIL